MAARRLAIPRAARVVPLVAQLIRHGEWRRQAAAEAQVLEATVLIRA